MLAVTPFEFHDRRATDLGGGLLGFVLDVLASAELALNLDVVHGEFQIRHKLNHGTTVATAFNVG